VIDLQKKMAGGIPLGYWVNYIAESGIGKSTLVNEAIRHMIFNAEYKVGILSLELSAAQYMIAMLSRDIGHKINLIESPKDAIEFIRRPEVMAARKHLRENEFGEERFAILDERDGDLDDVKKQCEILVNKHECKILVIDPIQDLFEGVGMDLQNSFVKWMKGMLKKGITFVNVCHVRKGNTSTDKEGKRILRELSEDDVHGISAVVKSAGANIFMSRNKYAEHDIEKNTTFVTLGKCRWTGNTGRVGSWYYNNEEHTMYDLVKYFKENPEKLPPDYDLTYNPFTKERSDGFSKRAGGSGIKKVEPETVKIEVEPLKLEPIKLPEFKEEE
jgi:KaiC/GvpD/RAD55 family RecA-like ATPase